MARLTGIVGSEQTPTSACGFAGPGSILLPYNKVEIEQDDKLSADITDGPAGPGAPK